MTKDEAIAIAQDMKRQGYMVTIVGPGTPSEPHNEHYAIVGWRNGERTQVNTTSEWSMEQ